MKEGSKSKNYAGKVRVRLYIKGAKKGKEVPISKEQVRHLKVLKVKEGEKICVFDGKGKEFEALYAGKVRVPTIHIGQETEAQKGPEIKVTLATCVPKASRMDFLTEKVSELGVARIIPMTSKRSVVKPRESKLERLRKVIIEACSQSGRANLPELEELISFEEVLGTIKKYDLAAICHKDGEKMRVGDAMNILLIVGPEGGFTEEEIAEAERKGCEKVSLGPTILRVETAGIAAVSQAIMLGD